jgi:hypothetical protein
VRCLRTLLAPAAGDNASGVIAGVYEQLLAKRGALLDGGVAGAGVVLGGSGDGAARSALRLGLLKSLAAHCRIVMEEELSSSLTGQVRQECEWWNSMQGPPMQAQADVRCTTCAEVQLMCVESAVHSAAALKEFSSPATPLQAAGMLSQHTAVRL